MKEKLWLTLISCLAHCIDKELYKAIDYLRDRIKAIVEATFQAKDYEPILTCGNSDGNGGWIKTLCVGQMQYGSGSFTVSQLALAGRIKTNPTAKIFALKLFEANSENRQEHS